MGREQFACIGGAATEHCHDFIPFGRNRLPSQSGRDRVRLFEVRERARPHRAEKSPAG